MIYVFLANGFEETEATAPIDILRRAELEVVTVGVGSDTITSSHRLTYKTDITDRDIVLGDGLDMIVLPGGMPGTLFLEKSQSVQSAIDFCTANDKYIGAICAAPSILGHKGLLKGKKAVCYEGFEQELLGAEVLYTPVMTDGKIITARGAGVAVEFGLELVANLVSREKSDLIRKAIML